MYSHHWELKKKFMDHHKDRFPEDALESSTLFTLFHLFRNDCMAQVGLAQTFGNMEFMGVQYPQASELMQTNLGCFGCENCLNTNLVRCSI